MSTYIALASYTDQGMRHVRESPARLDQAKARLHAMGGEFRAFYMTFGQYDLVFVYEAPDDAIAARFILELGVLGNIRTTTLKAFPEAAYRELIAHLR
ncbi:GYD domain-containing protein [Marinimicrococcus flavescens]|uniref:GYD domain-containing protein n=1 Tax=Marinimicrococcus flavescens TaxID=3031815 RepID=A0AAP4D689_9PROT|nr:GYD domain-containing protein [Marinimicrococcus flavescens]